MTCGQSRPAGGSGRLGTAINAWRPGPPFAAKMAHPAAAANSPLHDASAKRKKRCFSVNVALGRYYCHRCHSHGNAMELWAAATQLPLHQAVIDLCQRLGRDVPWIPRS